MTHEEIINGLIYQQTKKNGGEAEFFVFASVDARKRWEPMATLNRAGFIQAKLFAIEQDLEEKTYK